MRLAAFASLRKSPRAVAGTLCAVLVTGIAGCHGLTGMLVNRTDARAPRDAETGVLIGAEEQWLGPEDAKTAALLVHGFIGGGNNFGELPQRLAREGIRVRVMRLPGHGTSPRDFAVTTETELLDAVTAEAAALHERHERVVLVGHSMGAALSLLAAGRETPDGLVLAAPYFRVTHRWYYGLRVETWAGITAPILPWAYKGDHFMRVKRREARDEILSYRWVPAKGTRTLIAIGKHAREDDALRAVTCPVLMLHALGDKAASPSAARDNFEKIASQAKRAVWLENSDHHIFWDYEREMVIDEVAAFIRKIDAAQPTAND